MMWRSPKALDLLRDPRIVVHSVTCKREGTDGDIKLYGRAVAIDDLDLRTAYRAAIKARINWEPRKAPTTCSPWTSRRAAMSGSRARKKEIWTWDPTRGLHKDRRPALVGGQ